MGRCRRTAASIDRLAGAVAGLEGWRRRLFAGAAGALASLAFAPYDLWPVLFLSFGVLVWLLDGDHAASRTLRQRLVAAGITGFCFGFGFFLADFYWIAEAFLVEPWRHGWLIPFVLAGFSTWMALYFTGATMLAMACWGRGATRVFALALGFGIFEFVRGHLFTGQPWDLIGYGLTANLAMMQLASLFGVYALSLLAVIVFAAPFAVFAPPRPDALRRGSALSLTAVSLALLAIGTGWGAWRVGHAEVGSTGVTLRIVQASVPQDEKWAPGNAEEVFSEYVDLSRLTQDGVSLSDVDLLIWPETAIPVPLPQTPAAMEAIGDLLPDRTKLLVGSIRMIDRRVGTDSSYTDFYNGLLAVGSDGHVLDSYDKMHLVPFGEYLPFQTFMESLGIMQLTGIRGGFTAGRGPRRLEVPGAPPLMPLICYEILFPDEVNDDPERTGWMLNVTNDAWFGRSIGPYQHFHQARVRAVEQGLPLVRAANSGISAIVDPYGRIEGRLNLWRKGVLDGVLPAANSPSYFALYERPIEFFTLLLGVIGCLAARFFQLIVKLTTFRHVSPGNLTGISRPRMTQDRVEI